MDRLSASPACRSDSESPVWPQTGEINLRGVICSETSAVKSIRAVFAVSALQMLALIKHKDLRNL